MTVFRLCKGNYKNDLSGKGAKLTGGRWNSKGSALLYTAESRALCTAELAVHLPLGIVPVDYWMITIFFPDKADVFEVDTNKLPADWKTFPHPHSTQVIGDGFLKEGKFLVMKAPSAVVPGDFNYLINPQHLLFPQVKVVAKERFEFDGRLFRG